MASAYHALIPAAGRGSRFGETLPKQYQTLAGRTVLEHAVRALARHPAIASVNIVLAPGDTEYARCQWGDIEHKVVALFCGGATRGASVFNGLFAIREQVEDGDWILVHDAARPCLGLVELDRLLTAVGTDAVVGILALPLTDTLKRGDVDARIVATEPREHLWRALTPQMFRYRLLVEALHAADPNSVTDESSAIERMGLKPRLIAGTSTNLKITYAGDLVVAEAILRDAGVTACV